MARHLASIYATEKDRVNCPFYLKIGACRHGDRCDRQHHKPAGSPTLLLHSLYNNPTLSQPLGEDGLPMPVDPDAKMDAFEDFFEDCFNEMALHGEVEELQVCDNLGDHLVGNVYVKFVDEEAAARALKALTGRFYWGRAVQAEPSPVLDFRQASCRQYEDGACRFGGYCNYLHLLPVDRTLAKRTYGRQKRAMAAGPGAADREAEARERERQEAEARRLARAGSEERRAMFAQWTADPDGGVGDGGGGMALPPPEPPLPGPPPPPPA